MNIRRKLLIVLSLVLIAPATWAGNKDRAGQAAAGELLINPWAASSGVFALNVANVKGLEAMKNNIAGLANINYSEIGITHGRYLAGSGMSISNAGVAQPLGETGVIGINVMTFGFGEVQTTTVDNPGGGIGTFKPTFFNATLGFAKKFSQSMSAGIGLTFVNEAIANIKATALGIDAGIQYKTGKRDAFKIGITLRNIGTDLRFSGDGFTFDGNDPTGGGRLTVQQRSEKYQLPSQLAIGVSYDIYLDEGNKELDVDGNPIDTEYEPKHRLTPMFSFKSNSYSKDWLGLAAEYAYKEQFFGRVGFRYESNILGESETTTFYSGLSAGVGFMTNLGNDSGTKVAFDYGFNHTRINAGNHYFGIRIFLGSNVDAVDDLDDVE